MMRLWPLKKYKTTFYYIIEACSMTDLVNTINQFVIEHAFDFVLELHQKRTIQQGESSATDTTS